MDGFWLVQFEGMQGNGGGVVVLIRGKLFGGDSQTTYIGDYRTDGEKLYATAKIQNYVPNVANVIGVDGDYLLDVEGTLQGNVITAQGTAVGHDVAGMALRLTKISDLP